MPLRSGYIRIVLLNMKIEKVSIIAPVYNEAASVAELCERVVNTMEAISLKYEFILVNDGSKDNSWQEILNQTKRYAFVKGIDLAGNFGQTMALRAGFEKANGDVIIAMDGDLQHDPAYIPSFLEKISEGYDMVGGYKEKDSRSAVSSFLSGFAHSMICRISGVKLKYFGATFKAYRSYLINHTHMMGDAHRFLGALVARKGIRYTEIPIEINERVYGTSNYSWKKIFKVIPDLIFLKFIVSYMTKPFRLFGSIGAISFLTGFMLTIYLIGGSLFSGINIKEDFIAEFMLGLILMILGAIFFSFGIVSEIGVYNYFLKNNRSPYVVREQTQQEKRKVRQLTAETNEVGVQTA